MALAVKTGKEYEARALVRSQSEIPDQQLQHPQGVSCAHVLSRFCCLQLSVTLWTVARQAALPWGILQARIPE